MWIILWRTSSRVRIPDDSMFSPSDERALTEVEEEHVAENVTTKARKNGLGGDGFVNVISLRRECVMDPHTFGRINILNVRVDYIVATLETKLELNKFKITNPQAMKICRVVEQ